MSLLLTSVSHSTSLGMRLFSRSIRQGIMVPTRNCVSTLSSVNASPVNAHHVNMFPLNMLPLLNTSKDIGTVAITAYCEGVLTQPSIIRGMMTNLQSLLDVSIWLIKRTFQPSIIRKRRKHGFLRRQESVGGRRVLKRRKAKGRMRLGGS